MTEPTPDCERCDDTELDPDAYIPHETEQQIDEAKRTDKEISR
jgi:hypothetical protein